jgi:hypothetical protein
MTLRGSRRSWGAKRHAGCPWPEVSTNSRAGSAIKDERQFWAGALFVAFGVFTLAQLPHYELGTATHMGPGYFPMLIAIALVLFGSTAMWRSFHAREAIALAPWPLAPLLFTTTGVIAFALTIEHGLVLATLLLVGLSCYQRLLRKPLEVVGIFIAVTLLSTLVFIYGIGLPIAIW